MGAGQGKTRRASATFPNPRGVFESDSWREVDLTDFRGEAAKLLGETKNLRELVVSYFGKGALVCNRITQQLGIVQGVGSSGILNVYFEEDEYGKVVLPWGDEIVLYEPAPQGDVLHELLGDDVDAVSF